MESLMKQVTLIDTLGIFLPGAIFVVAVNFYGIWDAAAPWKALMGDDGISMLAYFVGLSYLCGSVIHQVSAVAEQLLMKIPCLSCSLHAPHWENSKVRDAYQAYFQKDLPAGQTKKDLWASQLEAGRAVFRTVRQQTQSQQMILFDAFYTMSRALVLTLFCVIIMVAATQWPNWKTILSTVAVCLVCMLVFLRRWVYYEARCIDEAYRIFLTYKPHQ